MLLFFLLFFSLSFGEYAGLNREAYYMKSVGEYVIKTPYGNISLRKLLPAVLTFVYTKCTGACYPYVLMIKDEVRDMKNVNFVVLSFDIRDNLEDMQRMAYELNMDKEKNWFFGVIDKENLPELLQRVGFHYSWSRAKRAYEHDLLLVGVDAKGNILWEIDGIKNLELLDIFLRELSGGITVFTIPVEKGPLSCFNYYKGRWHTGFGMYILFVPAFVSFSLALMLNIFLWKSRSRL
ncbi:MAG: hypothetical protein ABWK04_04610 [Hydrogenobacter sp.]|uniref:hypothetical protein n=1 Tax=Hydrogenobacter thermophilus TaxID=940 RepID=UPI0030FD1347